MRYLVDANVLSEATKPSPAPIVLDWIFKHETEVATSPIVLGELEYGILGLPAGKRRTRLMQWLAEGLKLLPVVSFDEATAHVWAELLAKLKNKGRGMPIKDSLIAASAIQHDLIVATRNDRDYRACGVRFINPFSVV